MKEKKKKINPPVTLKISIEGTGAALSVCLLPPPPPPLALCVWLMQGQWVLAAAALGDFAFHGGISPRIAPLGHSLAPLSARTGLLEGCCPCLWPCSLPHFIHPRLPLQESLLTRRETNHRGLKAAL